MARALTEDEQLRYPWASQINDYVPVGRWRRVGIVLAWAGFTVLVLGALAIYVITTHLHVRHGLPRGVDEYAVFGVALALMWSGFTIGLVTTVSAAARNAKSPLVWSIAAMLPALGWALIVLRSL
jgi:hypothetical protein